MTKKRILTTIAVCSFLGLWYWLGECVPWTAAILFFVHGVFATLRE